MILAGAHAYKIKKPVDLGFLDYGTFERRRFFCLQQLRLDRRLAAPLYLGLATIRDDPEGIRIDGRGPILEYAVHMRRFPAEAQWDRLLAAGRLLPHHLRALAERLAAFHEAAPAAGPDSPYGTPEAVFRPMAENFPPLADFDPAAVARLRRWSVARHEALRPLLAARHAEGCIRECHGDLHLGNIVLWDGRPMPFDGIEFSPALRWIDTMSELAFLTMDLEDRGRRDLAFCALNAYLHRRDDYAGLALLPFYQVYRALVRAKVNRIRAGQSEGAVRRAAKAACADYLALAEAYTRPASPRLILVCGPSGAGKSWLAARLAMGGAIWLRSDVERKRLFGLPPEARGEARLYRAKATAATYRRLAALAETVLAAGFSAIVDATFLDPARRAPFLALARRRRVPLHLLELQAPRAVLERRVEARAARGDDPSDADRAVLERQLRQPRRWHPAEQALRLPLRSDRPLPWRSLFAALGLSAPPGR